MWQEPISFTLFLVLALAGCASVGSGPADNAKQGFLVIGVGAGRPVSRMAVKDLDTGREYPLGLTLYHTTAVLPSGTYCVSSVTFFSNANWYYCGKPYFTLEPGEVLVVGYFSAMPVRKDHHDGLMVGFSDSVGLANSLSAAEKNSIQHFRETHAKNPHAGSTNLF